MKWSPTPATVALAKQFARFLLVGGTATAIHYVLLYTLHEGAGWEAVIATSVGFAVSALFNFTASYFFTFRSEAPISRSAARYALVSSMGMAINAGLFWLQIEALGLHYFVAQVFATGAVMFWNFTLGRLFTFAGRRTAQASSSGGERAH